jgi:hypothetical protein
MAIETKELKAGPELDTLVAEKVMGWQRFRLAQLPYGPEFWGGDDPDAEGPFVHAWKPSTDIAAAWQVVERFRDKRRHLAGEIFIIPYEGIYRCHLNDADGMRTTADADTAPLAICRAALAALGQ